MAGKSNRGKNKGRALNSNSVKASETQLKPNESLTPSNNVSDSVRASHDDEHVVEELVSKSIAVPESGGNGESTNSQTVATAKQAEGDIHLYPVQVKALSGEKLELQLSPGDSVMDVRQFLLDAPETCFFTCYDLILHTRDGTSHYLEDYNEISEVADITSGGCSIEMVAALYDDRSIRSHVGRARELLSLSSFQTSLSTHLALQHESTQQKTADAAKMESAEQDGLGFMEDNNDALSDLVFSVPSKEIKCVESIVFSTFNPPPCYRRLVGDLIYMDVVSLEGNKYCITGTTRSFYVNSSTNILDPKPSKPAYEASTLVGLLQKISSKFKKGLREILDQKASAHPFEGVQSLLPPNTWLGSFPIPEHKRDPARAEEALTLSFGSELIGMQRDWNEELQSCREFPHKTLQERILRGRALYKVTCDFVDAAVKGAMGVINRCIPPINPTDPECFHMYVHNNIFFSFAVDSDLGHVTKSQEILKFNSQTVAENSTDQTSCNSLTRTFDNKLGGATTNCNLVTSKSSDVVQNPGASDISTDASAEAQISDSEQATHASANNDLKGTKAYQEADVSGLHNLAMAIVDYRGYRVVAQSIIPGILQGDKSNSLVYGSVDNGKKISWNDSFHAKVVEAAKRLHLKEHSVLDGSGNAIKLAAPVECKGIVGSDDRRYLLDLMRVTPRDANYIGPEYRFCVLRPELVASFCQVEAAERSSSSSGNTAQAAEAPNDPDTIRTDITVGTGDHLKEEECTLAPVSHSISPDEILLNPNVFTEFILAGNQEEIVADEALVRKASTYLVDIVLPKFVEDLCSLDVSPMDGQTLADTLHAHGINIRYLGKVANMVKHLPHLLDICSLEIIVRSTKHFLKDLLRESEDHDLGLAISHFFNCFIGNVLPVGSKGNLDNVQLKVQKKGLDHHSKHKYMKGQMRWNHGDFSRKNQLAHALLTSEGLWSQIKEFAQFKYQFELPEDARIRVKKIAVIRNLCQKVGITIAARRCDFDAPSPFQASDILNLQTVVKHSVPSCSEAKDLMESGKAKLAEGLLNEAYTLFSEAFSILQQVTGPLHRDVASCCRYLAMVLYHAGDMAGAIVQQHKELIINERCLGLDHPDTAHSYGNMALFYHGLNQTELALRHMSRTLRILSLSSGSDHPDVAATFINVAMMYQDIGNMKSALRYLQEALKKNERLLGPDHIQTAVCYHALAIAFNCMGAYKLSIQHESKTHDILVKQLGEEDPRTRDSENWIKTFKLREQQVNAQKQKGQAVDPASALKAIDVLKANPELVQAFQAAAKSGNSSNLVNKSLNAAVIGEALPRGRGVDERAARAVAEARKRAAARGILVRPSAAPMQPLPSLSQLVNIINSSTATDTPATVQPQSNEAEASHAQPNEPKEAANGVPIHDSSTRSPNSNGSVSKDQAPVGLGTSLASQESKKQKHKSKSTV
ncbi:clustered mitochondria protein-like [Zingiber officinale]|uniref:clustered mitochondria protein-like n=1 Tax=Zingiber officinale TaxID=94328 RepID=UPI001C4D4BBC|nr:clustered mitochondria protein-like [Zingiber officinale]